jgi:uncharacterized membrane protein
MRAIYDFLKTSIMGGAVFLLPVVITVLLLNHALGMVKEPVRRLIANSGVSVDSGEVALVTVVAVFALLVVCFAAGLVAKTRAGNAAVHWLEDALLGRVPAYQMLKSATADLTGIVAESQVEVVLREADGGWQLGFVMERFDDGWCTLLLPEAPNAISGSIVYVRSETLRRAEVTGAQAMKVVKHGGLGSGALLRTRLERAPEIGARSAPSLTSR